MNVRLDTYCIVVKAPTRPEYLGCGCWIIGSRPDQGFIAQVGNGATIVGPARCFMPVWRAPVVAA